MQPDYSRFRRAFNVAPHRWFRVQNKAGADTATVYIFDVIGFEGVTASDFVQEINALTHPKIDVHLNTPGGAVSDALTIFNALRDHPAHVTTIVDGEACSAGSFILQAGDHRVMNAFSQLMIHDAAIGLVLGNATDMREMADFLDKASDNIAAIYASRTNTSAEEWRTRMMSETWYSADEAVEHGLADEARTPQAHNTAAPVAVAQQPETQKVEAVEPIPVVAESADPWAGFDWGTFSSALSGATTRKASA
jgi:ATP-dependent Clp endopeptidase proteolytic subunit ClpP